MVLGVGLVSAVLLNKKRKGYKTRLEKLKEKLQKRPPNRLCLYQFPLQATLILASILLFVRFLSYFEQAYIEQSDCGAVSSENSKIFININQPTIFYQGVKVDHDCHWRLLLTIQTTCMIYYAAVLCVLYKLSLKRVCISKPKDDVCPLKAIITIQDYSLVSILFCSKVRKQSIRLTSGSQFNIRIIQEGQQKFNNYSHRYTIQLTVREEGAAKQQGSSHCYNLISRSNVFSARKSVIELNSMMAQKPDLAIYDTRGQKTRGDKRTNKNK